MKEEIRNRLQLGEEEALTTRTLCEHVRASVEAGNELGPVILRHTKREQDIAQWVRTGNPMPEVRIYPGRNGKSYG